VNKCRYTFSLCPKAGKMSVQIRGPQTRHGSVCFNLLHARSITHWRSILISLSQLAMAHVVIFKFASLKLK